MSIIPKIESEKKAFFIPNLILTTLVICGLVVITILLTGCAEQVQKRIEKDRLSEQEGLNRVLTVYSNGDGKVLKEYRGKFDIEPNPDGEAKVKFDVGDKRVIIYNAIVICEEVVGGL